MPSRFFLYHYLHVCIILIGIAYLLITVLIVKPNLAKPEYFSAYSQSTQIWVKEHGKVLNRISYAIIILFIIGGIYVIWKPVFDIPSYVTGGFNQVTGEIVSVKSDGHRLELDNGETYVVDLKGAKAGDQVTLRYLPISHCSSFISLNGKDVNYH